MNNDTSLVFSVVRNNGVNVYVYYIIHYDYEFMNNITE